LTENYGQVHVTDAANGKALAKVYVKTYVRLADGQVKFHKDGYTDQRGRFDYASVSTPERQPPSRFAILVLSEDRGAQIREAAPPQQ
jgi:5-hydroxyisourate hydrolase-like protein (transthyretin family)